MLVPELEPRCDQLHVRVRPSLLEACVHPSRFGALPLRLERLREAEQGPAVLGVEAALAGLLAVDALLSKHQQIASDGIRIMTDHADHELELRFGDVEHARPEGQVVNDRPRLCLVCRCLHGQGL